MSAIYKTRKVLACMPSACLLAAMVYSATHDDLQIKPKYDESTVEVALIDLAELAPPPEPVPEVAPPPEPEPVPEEPSPPVEPVVAEAEVIEPPKPKPKPKPKPVEKPKPPVAKPAPPKPVVKTEPARPKPAPSQPVARAPAPVAPKPAPVSALSPAPAINTAALESTYTAALRRELEKYKQYPHGREASLQRPEGAVVLWLVVDRRGNVIDSGIETKARNMLLNRAAQTSLRRMERVSPFPAEAFAGKEQQRFTVTFNYTAEQ
ncbi:protein TonB [Pseudomonas duriflava]|uniref:Protein TonB n=1 Tax=Pseudomonas duriflava TaxID=459528 RepID=A0A562QDN7_9PSED|nr:energy transducer TonB [Pseudomonas duriflava]TWI54819.1 protein TonB [Pseudomonas duriflava]